MSKKVAIIGAGAAGMIAAVTLSKAGVDVDIFEQNVKVGKKIFVSGNGHCNITNTNLNESYYVSGDSLFVKDILNRFNFNKLESFLNSLGLPIFSKEDGKTYPLSYEAKSVVLIFLETLNKLGVELFYEHKIINIEKQISFALTCKQGQFIGYDSVIVTSGGLAAPKLGGNGDGYNFAKIFGHTITPLYPILVPLVLDFAFCKELSGVKIYAQTSLFINNKKETIITGDILFTKYGISGLAILDISLYASLALLNHQNVYLSLNLLPMYEKQSLAEKIAQLCKNSENISIFAILSAIVSLKLAALMLRILNIDISISAYQINHKQINSIASIITNFKVNVIDTRGYEYAEAVAGGVNLLEIDNKTMESKKCKNLYFAGEVLDVAGKRGGYNFHFAFASGFLAANSII